MTGGAGFIGSNLTDALLASGHEVRVLDNLSTGVASNLAEASRSAHFEFVKCDLFADPEQLGDLVDGFDAVFHLAANADVRFGWDHPRRDLEQNITVTLNVLDAMRERGVRRLLFSSTGSVYGEAKTIPTPESCPFPPQTSLYGASKVASEGYISAFAEHGDIDATVFRFVSIMGQRYSHGHVIDFVQQLQTDPSVLTVLGDGTQRKSYLDVTDCVLAMLSRLEFAPGFEVFNLGVDDYCTVTESVTWICERMGLAPEIRYSGGDRGWVGDNPFIYLDTTAIRSTGWDPKYSISEAVTRTVDYLIE